jgi:hypothetical protein
MVIGKKLARRMTSVPRVPYPGRSGCRGLYGSAARSVASAAGTEANRGSIRGNAPAAWIAGGPPRPRPPPSPPPPWGGRPLSSRGEPPLPSPPFDRDPPLPPPRPGPLPRPRPLIPPRWLMLLVYIGGKGWMFVGSGQDTRRCGEIRGALTSKTFRPVRYQLERIVCTQALSKRA